MDAAFLNLLAEGEVFLLLLAKHEQDTVIEQLPEWQNRVEHYVAQMSEMSSEQAQQKGTSLIALVQRLEQAFSQQAEWIKVQQAAQRQQYAVAQKYTQNV